MNKTYEIEVTTIVTQKAFTGEQAIKRAIKKGIVNIKQRVISVTERKEGRRIVVTLDNLIDTEIVLYVKEEWGIDDIKTYLNEKYKPNGWLGFK